jgi:HAD superfamily hydrolase (TIGR01509 family)
MIKNIIFDLDGVLIDSRHLHYIALNKALESIDPKYVISEQEHISLYDGRPTSVKLDLLTDKKGLPKEYHQEIWNKKQDSTIETFETEIKRCDRTFETIQYFHKNGYRLFCASNSIQKTLDLALKKLEIYDFFDKVYSNEDIENPKPHPEIYIKVIHDFHLNPKETIICEDSPIGRKSALDSGCHLCPVETPESLKIEYIEKWIQYINSIDNSIINTPWIMTPEINIVIPMAGAGSRFAKDGYTDIKPMISVGNKLMIQVVVDNMNIKGNYIFIVQKGHNERYNFNHWFKLICRDNPYQIVEVDQLTEGACCTVLTAKKLIDNDRPMVIVNSDQYIEWDANQFMYKMMSKDVDGGILTFTKENDPKWSYAKLDEHGFVCEVREKQPISNIATVGLYYWKRGSDFVKYSLEMISKNERVNNEFYVCPVYNYAIQDGKKIITSNCKEMWGLGVPEDLKYFLENYTGKF